MKNIKIGAQLLGWLFLQILYFLFYLIVGVMAVAILFCLMGAFVVYRYYIFSALLYFFGAILTISAIVGLFLFGRLIIKELKLWIDK